MLDVEKQLLAKSMDKDAAIYYVKLTTNVDSSVVVLTVKMHHLLCESKKIPRIATVTIQTRDEQTTAHCDMCDISDKNAQRKRGNRYCRHKIFTIYRGLGIVDPRYYFGKLPNMKEPPKLTWPADLTLDTSSPIRCGYLDVCAAIKSPTCSLLFRDRLLMECSGTSRCHMCLDENVTGVVVCKSCKIFRECPI